MSSNTSSASTSKKNKKNAKTVTKTQQPPKVPRPPKKSAQNKVVIKATSDKAEDNIIRGYLRHDQQASPVTVASFKARVEFLILAARQIDRANNPNRTEDATRLANTRIRDDSTMQAKHEFFSVYSAPFGRQKGVMYELNLKTRVVRYAGSVYTAQLPDDHIRPLDLKTQAEVRFNDNKRAISFKLSESTKFRNSEDIRSVDEAIRQSTYKRGVSRDSTTYRQYQRNLAQATAQAANAAQSQSGSVKKTKVKASAPSSATPVVASANQAPKPPKKATKKSNTVSK